MGKKLDKNFLGPNFQVNLALSHFRGQEEGSDFGVEKSKLPRLA